MEAIVYMFPLVHSHVSTYLQALSGLEVFSLFYANRTWYCVVPENFHTSPTEGIFSYTSPSLWKFQLSFIHFFKFFGLIEPPTPQEISIPSVGGVWIFSGTTHLGCDNIVEWFSLLSCNVQVFVVTLFKTQDNILPHFQTPLSLSKILHYTSYFKLWKIMYVNIVYNTVILSLTDTLPLSWN